MPHSIKLKGSLTEEDMIHGIINVYKEKGFTSHDVVAKLRGIIGQRKIGHTGTLDPDATGVLPVCLGKATKLCDLLADKSKTYEAVLLLGKTTDTQDITGTVLTERETRGLINEAVKSCVYDFIGQYEQVPPMYSALKVNGKKLYELAREGKEIERKARPVTIHEIQILEMDLPRVRISVTCSKGTYIRTLCHDIGVKLGCGGCMEELVRTRSGRFLLSGSATLSEVEEHQRGGKMESIVTPIDAMFTGYRNIILTGEALQRVYNGNTFTPAEASEHYSDGENVRVYDAEGQFIALYEYYGDQRYFKIVKMFFDRNEMTEELR